mgnify:CR=1 FL=1
MNGKGEFGMSEKRFSETERNCYYTSLVFDNQTQEELGTTKVVELLNELYGENKKLKHINDQLEERLESSGIGVALKMDCDKRKIQRFNLDEGRIWEAIEGLSPFKTTYTLEEVCEKLNELSEENEKLRRLFEAMERPITINLTEEDEKELRNLLGLIV